MPLGSVLRFTPLGVVVATCRPPSSLICITGCYPIIVTVLRHRRRFAFPWLVSVPLSPCPTPSATFPVLLDRRWSPVLHRCHSSLLSTRKATANLLCSDYVRPSLSLVFCHEPTSLLGCSPPGCFTRCWTF